MPRLEYRDKVAESQYHESDVHRRINEQAYRAEAPVSQEWSADRTINMVKGLLKEGDRRLKERTRASD